MVESGKVFYSIDNPGTQSGDVPSANVDSPFFYDRADGVFYAGDSSHLADSEGNEYAVPGSATGFAIVSSSSIYAGGIISTRLGIMRASGAAFVSDFEYSSGGGQMVLRVLDRGTLAVGVRGAGVPEENGLYLYSTSSKSLRKISSLPVVALYTRR